MNKAIKRVLILLFMVISVTNVHATGEQQKIQQAKEITLEAYMKSISNPSITNLIAKDIEFLNNYANLIDYKFGILNMLDFAKLNNESERERIRLMREAINKNGGLANEGMELEIQKIIDAKYIYDFRMLINSMRGQLWQKLIDIEKNKSKK